MKGVKEELMENNNDSLILKLYRSKFISSLIYSHLYFLKRELKDCSFVLDVGCGADSPLRYSGVNKSVGVDIFEPAIRQSKNKGIHHAYIIADINRLFFKPRSFDAIVLFEVLEHLDKQAGDDLLERVEQWAAKKVIVSCPNGYLAQPALYDNPYQKHRCGWNIEEIVRRGYQAYGMVGLRWKPTKFLFFPLAFWAVVSVFLEKLTYYHPQLAFEVCYIKNISKQNGK